MATTQHIVELLNKQTPKPDTKLTGDLVKYFVDIFGSTQILADRANSCLGPLGLGTIMNEMEEDMVASSPDSTTSPPPTARVSPSRVSPTLPRVSPPLSRVSPPLSRVSPPESRVSPPLSSSPPSQQTHHGTKQVFEEPSMEVVKYVMGKRGGCQIVWQGHRYTRDRTRNDQTYWACVLKRPPYRCKGRISTKRSFVTSATAHNHTHQTSKSQTARLIHQLKQKVQDSCTETEAPDIVLSCLQEFKFNESSLNEELPSFDTLVKMCKRIVKNRKKNEGDLAVLMNENYNTHKLLNKLPSNQFDYLLNGNKSIPMDYECNDNRTSISNVTPPLLSMSTMSQTSNQSNMDTSESLAQRYSLANSGLHLRSPLIGPNQHLNSTLPSTPSLLNGLFPNNLSANNFTMVPLSNFLPPTLTSSVSSRSTPSAFTSTSTAPNTLSTSHTATTPAVLNLKISSAVTLSDPNVDVTSLDVKSLDSKGQDCDIKPFDKLTSANHTAMLERGVSSITEIRAYLDEVEHLYRARVSEIKLIEENFKASREDLKTKDERIKSLQREVSKLDVALKVAQEGLQKVRTTAEDKVERSLIKAFFTQYLTAPDNRKPEVLRLMTSVLNYTEEELESLYKNKDKKWLSNLFNPTTHPAGTENQEPVQGQSFSELFVSFLETEANRGAIMGSRPLTSPPRRSSSSLSHQRTPSSSSYHHHRTLSNTSNNSTQSLPVVTSNVKESIVTSDIPATLSSSGGLPSLSTPLVVPASLADLLANKPR